MFPKKQRASDEGFALILALLSLLVLTFLGLTLAATTSTELQIATNYRWSQQAFYNAEAGFEIVKTQLRTETWATVLPGARATNWDGVTSPSAAAGAVTGRNYENWQCDKVGNGMGYGRVYADSVSTFGGLSLNGAFTVWVRRPLFALQTGPDAGNFTDYGTDSDVAILTIEGVAPFVTATSTIARANQAVRLMEARVTRAPGDQCWGSGIPRSGQAGGGTSGANYGSACSGLTDVATGLGLASAPTEFTNR